MVGKQAKILSDAQVERLLSFVSTTRNPIRNRVLVLLSLKAGLRAGEIAKLTWPMVLGPQNEIGLVIELRDHAAKKNAGRLIPMHPALRDALGRWRDTTDAIGPVVRSERGRPMAPVSIVNWFSAAYRHLGFAGCSSHSGRRTFITRAARLVHHAGGSTDLLGGHVEVMFDTLVTSIEHIRAGELRALGVTSATRVAVLPNVPAIAEVVPGYEADGWQGIGVPKDTPAEVVDKLNKEINLTLADPKFAARLTDLGGVPFASSPVEFAKFVAKFTAKWAKVIHTANIKMD